MSLGFVATAFCVNAFASGSAFRNHRLALFRKTMYCPAVKSWYTHPMPEATPTVLIVDDSACTRAALRTFIENKAHLRVCGEASNGIEAMELANQCKPDLVLMDLLMPFANGIESASAIRSLLPKTHVVVITMFPDLIGKGMARLAGIDFVIDKTKCAPALTTAIQTLFKESEPPLIAPDGPATS